MANQFSDNVSTVNATSLEVVSTLPTGLEARGVALDPTNGRLFLANDYSSNVSVISTGNGSLLTTIYTPGYSYALEDEFDPSLGLLYVLANNNPDLLAINPNSLALSQVISLEPNPGGAQFGIDPSTHVIYFPDRGFNSVGIIDQTNGSTLGTYATPLGSAGPTTTFFDAANGLLYVMLGGLLDRPGNQVLALNPTTGGIVADLTVGEWPNTSAFDSSRNLLYVDCQASDSVTVIDTSTNEVTATISFPPGSDPQGIAVDPSTGHLFVGELGNATLVELGAT